MWRRTSSALAQPRCPDGAHDRTLALAERLQGLRDGLDAHSYLAAVLQRSEGRAAVFKGAHATPAGPALIALIDAASIEQ